MKKIIIAITHLENDSQINAVKKAAKSEKCDVDFIKLSTASILRSRISMQLNDNISLNLNGRIINNVSFWFSTQPRCDAMYAIDSRYPNEDRLVANQFLTDINLTFTDTHNFYPGSFEKINIAESKIKLLYLAKRIGLLVPELTINSNYTQKKKITDSILYRKKLGFPTFISYDRELKREVVVEIANEPEFSKGECSGLWQWQSPIDSIGHVRCFAHKDKVFAKLWKRKSSSDCIVDYRNHTSEGGASSWVNYTLTQNVVIKLKKLLKQTGLKFACPEFLLRPDGELVFIDMNPCGDWIGFFNKKDEKTEIAHLILKTIVV